MGSIFRHKLKIFNPESGLGSHSEISIPLATSRVSDTSPTSQGALPFRVALIPQKSDITLDSF